MSTIPTNIIIPAAANQLEKDSNVLVTTHPVTPLPDEIKKKDILEFIENENVLIIGGTGSLGQHLIAAMLKRKKLTSDGQVVGAIKLNVMSRDENKQWLMKKMFGQNVNFFLGDVRDKGRLTDVLRVIRPSLIILAAALKHIDQCETNISECVATNILGAQNVVQAAMDHSLLFPNTLKTVLFVSTDKACAPINVYGMSKAVAERLFTHASYSNQAHAATPKFLCVRYGNVLNSRGSIIPLLSDMIKNKSVTELPLTHVDMTRFIMTLDQSINLIFHALAFGHTGETWILIVKAIKILDLFDYFSGQCKKPVVVVGTRPGGEKLHEALINDIEMNRTDQKYVHETGHQFFVIQSSLKEQQQQQEKTKKINEYTSEITCNFNSDAKALVESILS